MWSAKTSAMATSFTGPPVELSALSAAPVPRPPQPIKATWMRLLPAAWTRGKVTPARAEAAAIVPVVLIKSRREVRELGELGVSFITKLSRRFDKEVNSRFSRAKSQIQSLSPKNWLAGDHDERRGVVAWGVLFLSLTGRRNQD